MTTFINGVPVIRRVVIPRIDNNSIPVIETTGYVEDETVNWGLNPCVYRALPNRVIVLWKVRHPATAAGATLPAAIVVPAVNSGSTVVTDSNTIGTKRLPLIDNKSAQVVGGDVTNEGQITEHIVYIDKCAGIFRLLGVSATTAAPPAVEAQSIKSK